MALDRKLVAAALPGYEVGDEIGHGGWGAVYIGRHVALDREVAIKQLPRAFAADERALDRFISEARTIGQLDHPHIVKVYDFVSHEGTWLIVMEFLGGGTLWDRFNQSGITADQACAVALAICAGLDVAHSHGILHRDVKPENIMFTSDGTVRVGDFGIAKTVDRATRHTHVGEVVGTPTYMSPEQAMGDDLGPGSDVYSLGVVLYELLAGRLPFPEARSPTQQLVQHVSEQPIPLSTSAPNVPGAIADAVMTSLEKRPVDRYASAQAFGVALAHAAAESFGAGWLQASGIVLMGGDRIQAAALRDPTMGAPVRQPTFAQPALRTDHFRPQGDDATPFRATVPPESAGAVPPPTMAPIGAATPPSPPSTVGVPVGANGDDGSSHTSTRRGIMFGSIALVLLVALGVFLVLNSRGDDSAAAAPTSAIPSSTITATTLVAPTTSPAAPLSVVPTTAAATTTPPATTAAPERECPTAERCAFIDSVSRQGYVLSIEWTAIGFEPQIAEGHFHVHFFWDIYSPDQVGTNASVFGVSIGQWELTDDQPFVSSGEMLATNRPTAANRICVTTANPAHAVVNPLLFDCFPIPDGV